MSESVYVNATASFFPHAPVSNEHIENVLGTYRGKTSRAKNMVLANNGIQSRHYAIDPLTRQPTHNNAEMTAEAVRAIFTENPSLKWSDVGLLACGTSSPDLLFPAHGQMVHGELKNFNGEVMTTAGVCCSSMAAFKSAYLSVLSGDSRAAIVTGSEASSKFMRSEFFESESETELRALEKNPAIGFGHDFLRWMLSDGACAVYLSHQPVDGKCNLKINWIEGRSYANEQKVCMLSGGYQADDGRVVPWKDLRLAGDVKQQTHAMNVHQDVRQLREMAPVYTVERALTDIKKKRGLRPGDYSWFLPHYSSHFFRDILAASLAKIDFAIPEARWHSALYHRGNVGSASIFASLDELIRGKDLQLGQKILGYVPESARMSVYYFELEVV